MKRLALVAVLVMVALSASACGGSDDIKKAHLSMSGANITFDYPAIYEMAPGPEEWNVHFVHVVGDGEDGEVDRRLFVGAVASTRNAFDQMQDDLWETSKSARTWEPITDGTIEIAGYQADVAGFDALKWNTGLNSGYVTYWIAYFNRNGYIWELGIAAITDLKEAAAKDFALLVDSFAFE